MKLSQKFISILGLILIIAVSSTFFSCNKNENEHFTDIPVQFELKIDASNQKNIKIEEKIEYVAEVENDKIILSCYALAYKDKVVEESMLNSAYPNGFNAGNVKFDLIKVNGQNIDYSINDENQAINIDKKTKIGDKLIIEISYDLTLANVKHRLGYYDDFYSLTGFYPYVAPVVENKYSPRPYSKIGETESLRIANFDVELTLPTGNVIANTGEIEGVEQGENTTAYHIKAENVRDFSVFWSKKITRMTKKCENVTIKYYFSKDSTPTQELDLIENVLNTFSDSFGNYGHKNFSVVLAPFAFAGMEYSEIAIISDELSEKAKNEVIIHETAHQWWYMKVASDQAFSPWLDESLAEFSTALYYLRNNDGSTFEKYRQYGLDILENRILTKQPYAIKGKIYDFDSSSYSECVYGLGSLMWINLYSIKGPTLIDDLKTYASKYENKIADEKAVKELVFKGYEKMLEGWLDGKVLL